MASSYTAGGVASCLVSDSSSHSTSKQTKLQALFNAPSALSSQVLANNRETRSPEAAVPPAPQQNDRVSDVKKSAAKKHKWESVLVLKRESSLRNANIPRFKKPKSLKRPMMDASEPPAVETEMNDNGVEINAKETNVECARVRVESKTKGIVRNIRKSSSPQEDHRTVFVGNVALSVDKKKLLKLFRSCGKVETVRIRSVPVANLKLPKKAIVIKKEFHPQRHNMNAYIVFDQAESALKAVQLNGREVDGLHIRVDLAPKEKGHDHKKSVFVGNLPFDVEEESVWSHFQDCGRVTGVRIIRDRATGLGKGFGYVMFQEASSVDLAMTFGEPLQGRTLRIQRSVERPQTTTSTNKQGGQKKNFKTVRREKLKETPPNSKKLTDKVTSAKKEKPGTSMRSRTNDSSKRSKYKMADAADGKKRKEVRKKKLKMKQRDKKKTKLGQILVGAKQTVSKTD